MEECEDVGVWRSVGVGSVEECGMWECGGGGCGRVCRCELSVGVSGYGAGVSMDENKKWSDVCAYVCVCVWGCGWVGVCI